MANTKLWDWFEAIDDKNLSATQLHKLYTQAFFIVLLTIMIPIMLSSALNIMGWNGGIMWVLALATLLYIWVLSNPILLALKGVGMAFGGSVPGKAATEISNKIYLAILYLILGSPIAHLLLVVFPLDGHGGQALTMLAMVPLVVIGTVWLSSGSSKNSGSCISLSSWVASAIGVSHRSSLISRDPLQAPKSTPLIRQCNYRMTSTGLKKPRRSGNASIR